MRKKQTLTIYDIAKEAGVSGSMVSRVISGKGAVSEEKRKKIQELLDLYQFKPNANARGLQQRRTKMIGFLLPHIGHQYFSSVYYEFDKRASAEGFVTVLFNGKSTWETEVSVLNAMEELRVEAIIIMGGSADNVEVPQPYMDAVRRINKHIPCVICGEQAERFGCVGVHPDSKSAGILVRHMKEQGVDSLGIIGGAPSTLPSILKKESMKETARECGVEIREEWMLGISYDAEDGYAAMEQLLRMKERPRGVCCINDHVAVGAMHAAFAAGVKVPEEIMITGYDGVDASTNMWPSITTVRYDYSQYGERVFEVTKRMINGEECPAMTWTDHELLVRDSTMRK